MSKCGHEDSKPDRSVFSLKRYIDKRLPEMELPVTPISSGSQLNDPQDGTTFHQVMTMVALFLKQCIDDDLPKTKLDATHLNPPSGS